MKMVSELQTMHNYFKSLSLTCNFVHHTMVIEAPPNPKQTTGMFVLIILLLLVLLANRINSVEYMMYGRLVEYLRARHLRPGALVPAHVAH